MNENVKNAIEEYQCSGCIKGSDISCFKSSGGSDLQCSDHFAGTFLAPIGKIFMGMPKGFNRLGQSEKMQPQIFDKFEDGWGYTIYNIPVWKYKNEAGHTFVRGISPRINSPFIHVFLEDCIDKIDCLEITEDHLSKMD